MNAELEAIRDNLRCGHCLCLFQGSNSQAWKVKYEKRTVYCSGVCRYAALSKKLSKPIPNRGPCKTCGKEFFSRTAKEYCTMDCYTKSEQFRKMIADNFEKAARPESIKARAQKQRRGENAPCMECGVEFYQKRARESRPAKRFCSKSCYRSYLAKRFDRWIANPEGIALPQCYDEFLEQEELECVVEGCNWRGKWLTLHLNQTHGIKADEFKRVAGFNKSTGVVALPLAQSLCQRKKVGVAINPVVNALGIARDALAANNKDLRRQSLEGKEHARKARLMWGPGPQRQCKGCGKDFQQSTPAGKALYCSVECRDAHYSAQNRARAKQRVRQQDGTFKWVAPGEKE